MEEQRYRLGTDVRVTAFASPRVQLVTVITDAAQGDKPRVLPC